jgi:hypothetical protein
MAGRTTDPNYFKVLYVKKGKTALYYKRATLKDPEQGFEVKEGKPVGNYLRTVIHNGVTAMAVSWPSDTVNPERYVNGVLVDFVGMQTEPGKDPVALKTNVPGGYDPAKDPENETQTPFDSTWLLAGVLGVVLMVKFVLPKYR